MKVNCENWAMVLLLFSLWSCNNDDAYQNYRDFEYGFWHYDSVTVFTFEVNDTSPPHDLSYRIRNTASYPYFNIYVKYELLDPEQNSLIANMEETYLMHPKTGEPFGKLRNPKGKSATGHVFEHSIPIASNFHFANKGMYQFKIRQYMRVDILPEIVAIGFQLVHTPEEK